jgi:hypothetical protein
LGTNTFTKRSLQTDLAFGIRRKCPFKSTKSYTKEKCRSRSLSHGWKNPARRTAGPPATSENPRPRSLAASTLEDLAGSQCGVRPDLLKRSARKQRSGRAWDSVGCEIWPNLSNPHRPSVGFRPDRVKNPVAEPVRGGRERLPEMGETGTRFNVGKSIFVYLF